MSDYTYQKIKPDYDIKQQTYQMVQAFSVLGDKRRMFRLSKCLSLSEYVNNNEFVSNYSCSDRFCPSCAFNKSVLLFNTLYHILHEVKSGYENLVPYCWAMELSDVHVNDFYPLFNSLQHRWMKFSRAKVVDGLFRTFYLKYVGDGSFRIGISALLLLSSSVTEKYLLSELQSYMKYEKNCSFNLIQFNDDDSINYSLLAKLATDYNVFTGLSDLEIDELSDVLCSLSGFLENRHMYYFGGVAKEIRATESKPADTLVLPSDIVTTYNGVVSKYIKFKV